MNTSFFFRRALGALTLSLAGQLPVAASISLDLKADLLQTSTPGTAMPSTGLVLLIADTLRNGFGPVSATSIGSGFGDVTASGAFLNGAGGDDLVLWRGNLTNNNIDGRLDALPLLTLGTYNGRTWDAGDPLALYWFPNLTTASTSTSLGNVFGDFTSGSPLNGAAWITPADGSSGYALYVFTPDGAINQGSTPSSSLVANMTLSAVPEPPATIGLMAASALVTAMVRRNRRRPPAT